MTATLSCVALIVSVAGIWFQFFWSSFHLSFILTSEIREIGPDEINALGKQIPVRGMALQYDLAFLNNGNRPMLVSRLETQIQQISKPVIDVALKADASLAQKLKKDLRTEEDIQGYMKTHPGVVLQSFDMIAKALPPCKETIFGENPWTSYVRAAKDEPASAFVVKGGEFEIINKTTFKSDVFDDQLTDQSKNYFLVCLRVYYVNPNGFEGMETFPIDVFGVSKTEDRYYDTFSFALSGFRRAIVP